VGRGWAGSAYARIHSMRCALERTVDAGVKVGDSGGSQVS
jgi:hypothetical protein